MSYSAKTVGSVVMATTTVASASDARRLAASIVKSRLAACVQYFPIKSVYWWKGRMESASEFLLLAKTRRLLERRLVSFIRKNHSYELPEITVWTISSGLTGYLQWVCREATGRVRAGRRRGV